MIKIAYIVSTLKRSGPINILYNIVKYLDKNKFKVYIISLSPEGESTRQDDFVKLGCEILNLRLSRINGIFKARKKIIQIIEEKKIQIIHGHGIRADNLISKLCRLDGVESYSTLHNYPIDDYVMKFGKIKGILMSINHIKATKKIKNSIACSKSISKLYKEKNSLNIKYIQNGVDQNKFNIKNNKNQLRKKLNLPLDKKIFISVGSLITRKDPLTIIKAFNNIKDYQNRKLIFLGDGFLKNECLTDIKKNDNIELVGNVPNVNEYLQAADYFISASKSEGLPNTVMEAMACGLPCVLSDIPPHKEILDFDNTCGKTFKTSNSNELINIIFEIEKQDYCRISKNAVKLIENNLNAEIMSKKYQELYLEIN